MKSIKPINYENIIVEKVNAVYENFKSNCNKDFNMPENINNYFKNNQKLKTRKDIETLGIEIDKSFGEWSAKDNNMDKMIILNHFMSILQNAIITIITMDMNLKNENLDKAKIIDSKGVDILIATAVQALGVKTNELLKKYNQLNLDEDPQKVFKTFNSFLNKVANQDATGAFSNLMNNVLEFIQEYKIVYLKLSKITDDNFSSKRIEIFMAYLDTYYLISYFLELMLIYPLQEGKLEQKVFENMSENINLYN